MDTLETYADAVGVIYKLNVGKVKTVTIQKGPQRITVSKNYNGLYVLTWVGTDIQKFFGYEGAIGHINGLFMRGAVEVEP